MARALRAGDVPLGGQEPRVGEETSRRRAGLNAREQWCRGCALGTEGEGGWTVAHMFPAVVGGMWGVRGGGPLP